ncbi:hypothetical protein B0H11DRAFT_1716962 [Mycena galericulata]|nr:hypothetical protein B0H11DRAFT_1716962 [Mycena galericulata]
MEAHIGTVLLHLKRNPRAAALAAVLTVGTPWVVNNYRKYLSLGESVLTRLGPLGWLVALTLTGLGRETLSTEEYARDPNKERWLEVIPPERRGARPTTGWHCVPHRQLDRFPTDEMAKRLVAIFEKHCAANTTLVKVVPSPHEVLDPGIIIHPDIPSPHKDADQDLREIAHIHPIDHSLHVVLSPADCKTVVDLGWGQRHPLSGVNRFIPAPNTYLLIYAPRDEEELDVVERIIVASIGYMTNSRSVA